MRQSVSQFQNNGKLCTVPFLKIHFIDYYSCLQYKKRRTTAVFQGLANPSVIAQRAPGATPEQSFVHFYPLFDVGLQSQANIFKWLSPAVLLYILEGHCDHQQIAVNQEDTWLPLSDRTIAAGSKVFRGVHLQDYRNVLNLLKMAVWCERTLHCFLHVIQTRNEKRWDATCVCTCNLKAVFWQIFSIKLCKSRCSCKQAPEKCKQIAASLPITSANCLGFKINPPKLAPFAP